MASPRTLLSGSQSNQQSFSVSTILSLMENQILHGIMTMISCSPYQALMMSSGGGWQPLQGKNRYTSNEYTFGRLIISTLEMVASLHAYCMWTRKDIVAANIFSAAIGLLYTVYSCCRDGRRLQSRLTTLFKVPHYAKLNVKFMM
jgi:hypothetical protein